MSIKDFFDNSKTPEEDKFDLLSRYEYAKQKDPVKWIMIIGYLLFLLFFLFIISSNQNYINLNFGFFDSIYFIPILIVTFLLYRFYPRKCKNCGKEMRTAWLSSTLIFCCDKCRVKIKTLLSNRG